MNTDVATPELRSWWWAPATHPEDHSCAQSQTWYSRPRTAQHIGWLKKSSEWGNNAGGAADHCGEREQARAVVAPDEVVAPAVSANRDEAEPTFDRPVSTRDRWADPADARARKGSSGAAQGESAARLGYAGEYNEHGERHGWGSWTTEMGTYYGYFEHNAITSGSFTAANGDKYEGSFRGNTFHGYGTATFANGNSYAGEYENGMMHGQGELRAAKGGRYVGSFRSNVFHGLGTYYFPKNGDRFVGDFKDGRMSGYGTMFYAMGGKPPKRGHWENNEYVGPWQAKAEAAQEKNDKKDENVVEGRRL